MLNRYVRKSAARFSAVGFLTELTPRMAKYLNKEETAQPSAILFGARLKEKRLALGLTQAELYEQTGITASYISVIERGEANPTLEMVEKLSDAVNSTAWDMIRPAPKPQK